MSGEVDEQEEREGRLYWRRVRRRLLGAATFIALIGILWQLGDNTRAPQINPAAPQTASFRPLEASETLQNAATELQVEISSESESEASSYLIVPEKQTDITESEDVEAENSELSDSVSDDSNSGLFSFFGDSDSSDDASDDSAESDPTDINGQEVSEVSAEPDDPVFASSDEETSVPTEEDASSDSPKIEARTAAAEVEVSGANSSTSSSSATARSPYGVQVAALASRTNAERLARKLRKFGHEVLISSVDAGGKTLYRVRLHGYGSKSAATAAQRQVIGQDKDFQSARVVDTRNDAKR